MLPTFLHIFESAKEANKITTSHVGEVGQIEPAARKSSGNLRMFQMSTTRLIFDMLSCHGRTTYICVSALSLHKTFGASPEIPVQSSFLALTVSPS